MRRVSAAISLLPLLAAVVACSGGDESSALTTSERRETPPTTPTQAVDTVEPEADDPGTWRIRANVECNSMNVFYEAIFRPIGDPTPSEIVEGSAKVLRDWHTGMVELGAPETDRAVYEEALDRYEDAIADFESGSGGAEHFDRANRLMASIGLDTCRDVVNHVRSGLDPYVAHEVVIHEEDFTRRASQRWTTSRNDNIAFDYTNGRYRVRVLDPSGETAWLAYAHWAGSPRENVRVEVDTVLQDGASGFEMLGVLCLTGSRRGYFFGVGPEEGYASIEKLYRERFVPVEDDFGAVAVRPRVNHVRGECRGSANGPTRVRLVVNGKVVHTYDDPKGYRRFRQVGISVFAPNGGLEVLFDNVRATELRPRGTG